jgi:dienelactone hydrolase
MVAGRKVVLAVLSVLLVTRRGPAEPPKAEAVLVVFHGCHEGASSRDWKPLEDELPSSFRIIAPELPRIEADGDNTAWMAAWRKNGTAVVDRAFARARQDAPDAFLVAGGAGCGGFFALIGAERHDLGAVVTLSGLSDAAQRDRLASRRPPVLGVASKNDRDVASRVEAIVKAGGPGSRLEVYPGDAHGTAILASQPGSAAEIVRWVRERATERPPRP